MVQYIREYMTMLKVERTLAKNTLESYQRDLNQYHSFLKDNLKIKSIKNVTLGHIRSYVRYLSDKSMACLLYTSPSPRDRTRSRMPSSA